MEVLELASRQVEARVLRYNGSLMLQVEKPH